MSEITADQLKAKLEAGDDLELIDIREPGDFASWHIVGSKNLPVYDALRHSDDSALIERAEEIPKGRPVVAVCKGGIMSMRAVGVLQALGYEAISLAGGMRGWGTVWTRAEIPLGDASGRLFQIRRNGKGCLSYLLASNGKAAVVDPSVDVAAYLDLARELDVEITHVFETHVHADHLSRARELAAAAGGTVAIPETDRVHFDYTPVRDGDRLVVGDLQVEVVSTPGHTSESCCFLVGDDVMLSGDTLFVNAVGRPDLEKGDAGAEAGARALYRTLHERVLTRSDDLRIYPTHHGRPIGFDGRAIGATLGAIRGELDLLAVDEEAFVERILASLRAKPGNFETILALNEGRAGLGGVDLLALEAGPNSCAAG
jgi:glyoxylase-like metal-dependent hydrolase (beta-lactamase superfamily II)